VGIGASLGLAGVPVVVSVPIAAVAIWLVLVRGSYRGAERLFVWMTIPFFAYPLAAVLAKPDWRAVGHALVAPQIQLSSAYLLLFVAMAGTTITPYMQLYLQSAVVERGSGRERVGAEEADATGGAIFANLIACFIIVATGATLFVHGNHHIASASEAAQALKPLAGSYAELLFGVGLLGASLLAAAILPVTTAYVVAESFGFEKGLSHRPREAPVFVGVITVLIGVAAAVAMVPGVPVFALLVGVQVVNGALLPITLVFAWRLARDREVMGPDRIGRTADLIAGATVILTSALSLALLTVTLSGR
jgi:Mn2+/Fe2+ NRAMP family transporter